MYYRMKGTNRPTAAVIVFSSLLAYVKMFVVVSDVFSLCVHLHLSYIWDKRRVYWYLHCASVLCLPPFRGKYGRLEKKVYLLAEFPNFPMQMHCFFLNVFTTNESQTS